MRPGLAVAISTGSDSRHPPFQGSVFKVRGKEAIILFGTERSAPALRLKPGSSIRISYRTQADGAIYFIDAEVKAKDGPRSLAVKLLGPPVVGEDRDEPRVEQLLRMNYEVVAPADVERTRTEIQRGAQIVKYETELPERRHVAGEDELTDQIPPPLLRHLARIDRKLDMLIERLGIEANDLESQKPLFNASLSTRGVRFRDISNRCTPGDTVRLQIELPLNPTVEVIALGEVIRIVDTTTGEKLSMGRDVVIEFTTMREQSRHAIERFTQLMQRPRARRSA